MVLQCLHLLPLLYLATAVQLPGAVGSQLPQTPAPVPALEELESPAGLSLSPIELNLLLASLSPVEPQLYQDWCKPPPPPAGSLGAPPPLLQGPPAGEYGMPPANPPQENGPSLPFSSPPGYGLPPDWGNPSPAPIGPQVWPPADAPSQQLPSPSTIPLPSLPPLASPSTPPAPLATPPPFTPTPPTSAPQSSTPPPLNGVTPPPNGVEGPKPTGGQPPTVSSQASGAPPPQSSPPVFAAPLPAPGPSESFDALAAAIATAADDLARNAAALQALGSPSTTTLDDVQAIARRMRLGSLGPLLLAPLSGGNNPLAAGFPGEFPRYNDVMTQLGNFYSSLLSIPNHPWSSEVSPTSVTSQAPLDVYVWYHNMYTSTAWSALNAFIGSPTNESQLTDLTQSCQGSSTNIDVAQWLVYITAATDPTGVCTYVCLFNPSNGVNREVMYNYRAYLPYAEAFISDATFTTELASACDGVDQEGAIYLYGQDWTAKPFDIPYYQANYTSITQNVVDYGTNLTNLFWNAQLMTDLVTSFNNSITDYSAISTTDGGQNQYLASQLQSLLASKYTFMSWSMIVFAAEPSGADGIVGGCTTAGGNNDTGALLPDPYAYSCTNEGGSLYNSNLGLPSGHSIGFALFFSNAADFPPLGPALNDTLTAVCEGCQSNQTNNNDPQLMVLCINSTLSSARGVVAVSFSNALRSWLVLNVLFFQNLPINSPDTSFIILPAATNYN